MVRCPSSLRMVLTQPLLRCSATVATALLLWPANASVVAAPRPCPAPLVAQIDGLYRWHVARQNAPGPIDLSSQSGRFTPSLARQLQAAFRLDPADGRFVDFDVFSGTQVGTFGARVLSCSPGQGSDLDALVSVQVGRRTRPTEKPVLLRFSMRPGPAGAWQIADIHYPVEPAFRLTSFLKDLLTPSRP